jgi:hypothetical protein
VTVIRTGSAISIPGFSDQLLSYVNPYYLRVFLGQPTIRDSTRDLECVRRTRPEQSGSGCRVVDDPCPWEAVACVPQPVAKNQLGPGRQYGVYGTHFRTPSIRTLSRRPYQFHLTKIWKMHLSQLYWKACIESSINFSSLTVANYAGSGEHYIVAANNEIVASLWGTTRKLCQYSSLGRTCERLRNFTTGTIIDFTFDIGPGQIAKFIYSIIGAS